MWLTRWFAVLAATAVMTGCGPSSTRVPVKPPSGQEQMKSVLQDLAKTGELTSGVMIVRQELEEMKKSDSAKAEALLKDFADLEQSRNSAAIKAKAQKMLEKL